MKNMKSNMKLLQSCIMLGLFSLLIVSCSKDDKTDSNPGTAALSIRMTDAPGNYDAVFIDLKDVEITGSAGNATMLNVNPGIYNLLDFANGMDTLIATGTLQAGKIEQVRLILGDNNSVVVDSVSYPLSTPSAQQSGLKLQVHETFVAGVAYELLLDFDAAQSIVVQGNGSYQLKPVIRVIDIAISGSIKGRVLPAGAQSTITADNGMASYSTVSDLNGNFLLRGIPPGNYTVTITPQGPFTPVTLNNISVTLGAITDLGNINL
jgi:hypothetical protein